MDTFLPMGDEAPSVADLHRALRRFLVAECGKVDAPIIALVLMYEVASIVAGLAATPSAARLMLVELFEGAARQIRALGVGRVHP